MPRYSASASRPLSDRCWCCQAARHLAESCQVSGSPEFPASRAAKPRHWSAGLPA
jgi:hypothetical protein